MDLNLEKSNKKRRFFEYKVGSQVLIKTFKPKKMQTTIVFEEDLLFFVKVESTTLEGKIVIDKITRTGFEGVE